MTAGGISSCRCSFLTIIFPILLTPSKAFVSFNPTFKALYFYFTDIVSDHTVADINTDMTVLTA